VIRRLENGLQGNPTLETFLRYVEALGKQFTWAFEDLPPADQAGDGTVGRESVTPVAATSKAKTDVEERSRETDGGAVLASQGLGPPIQPFGGNGRGVHRQRVGRAVDGDPSRQDESDTPDTAATSMNSVVNNSA